MSERVLIPENIVRFKAVRSSGAGGQNANRRSTKAQLHVSVGDLPISEEERKLVREKLAHHVNHKDELWVENEEERSQEMNRDKALARLNEMVEGAIKVPEERIPGEPTRGSDEFRIREKKIQGEKKKSRRTSI